jgi:hypothetical protein
VSGAPLPQVATLGLDALVTNVGSVDSAPTADGSIVIVVTGALARRTEAPAGSGAAGAIDAASPRSAAGGSASLAAAAAAARMAVHFVQTFFLAPQDNGFFVAVDIMRFVPPPPNTAAAAPLGRSDVPVPMPIAFSELSLADAAAAAAAAAASSPSAPGTPPQLPSSLAGGASRGHYGGGGNMMHQQQQQQQQQHWGAAAHHGHASYDAAAYAAAMQAEHARAYAAAYGHNPWAGGSAYYAGGAHPGSHHGLPPMRHERGSGRRAPNLAPPLSVSGDDTASIFVRRLPADVTAADLEREFARFGPLRGGAAGVTLKSSNNRYFAFLEFESRDAAQAAQAAHVEVAGRAVEVEPKRPMGGSRGRGRGRGRGAGYGAGYGAFGREEEGGGNGIGADGAPEQAASPPPPPPPPGDAEDSAAWPRPTAD